MIRKRFTVLVIFIFLVSGPAWAWQDKCYALNGSSEDLKNLISAAFRHLEISHVLPLGFPRYAKTKIVGEYWGPHTVSAEPVDSLDNADSILVNDRQFVQFSVWGLNARATIFIDSIYLLKEKDEDAIQNGMKGFRRYKYIEVDYHAIMPTTELGFIGGDFSFAQRIVDIFRNSFIQSSLKEVKCQ